MADYHIMRVIEFDSDRKAMTIVVQETLSSRIFAYVKGADSSVYGMLDEKGARPRSDLTAIPLDVVGSTCTARTPM